MNCLIVPPLTKQDFRDIVSYKEQTWGTAQSVGYGQKINHALNAIGGNPDIGGKRHGRMVYTTGRRRIYYQIKDTEIWVLRILHD
jgi:plasmid stabilization system protein ParE